MPPSGLVSFSGLSDPCPVGSIVQVVINAHGDASAGAVEVEATSPTGRALKCHVQHSTSYYTASFTPHEVGTWKIGILYDKEHINESPFDCKVFDASTVNVYGLDVGLVGQQLKFSVNTSQAGAGHLEVSVLRLGHSIPCEVFPQGGPSSGLYTVTFVPDGAGQYNIHVLFNSIQVKGSPFILDIADASSVSVYGENLRVASVDRLSTFIVHAVNAHVADITVSIRAPSGKEKLARVAQIDPDTFRVEWKAVEAGEHAVDVRLFDQSVYEQPIICNVGDPELVTVKGMPRRIMARNINQDHSFEIDASAAGSGNLEIMINGGRVPCRVRELGSRQYLALFTPSQSVEHLVEMRFNGEEVRGSPWRVAMDEGEAMDRSMSPRGRSIYSEISGAGLVRAAVGKVSTFDIAGDSIQLEDIRAAVTTPDGRQIPVRIFPESQGKFTAEYRIFEVGEHQLNVWIAERKVDTSPLYIAGYSAEKVRLEPLGGGVPGQPVQFIVDAVDAGKGQLEISVNQGRVPNNVQMQGAGRCLVTFIPQQPGTYVIDVTFNGELVHGCPIRVEILPKQVGQTVAAPLHAQSSFSPGAAVGGSSVGRAPTSPTLLRHARQRSEEEGGGLRSASLLRDLGSPRMHSRHEAVERETRAESSPPTTIRRDTDTAYAGVTHGGGHQPPRHFAETTTYTMETPSASLRRVEDVPPSRQLGQTVYRQRSPSPGRRRAIEEMDPVADEYERESRRGQWQRTSGREKAGVGYTVAQYGEERERTGPGRSSSPTYHPVYESRFARGGRPPTPPRDFEDDKHGIVDTIAEKSKEFSDRVHEQAEKAAETVGGFFHRDQREKSPERKPLRYEEKETIGEKVHHVVDDVKEAAVEAKDKVAGFFHRDKEPKDEKATRESAIAEAKEKVTGFFHRDKEPKEEKAMRDSSPSRMATRVGTIPSQPATDTAKTPFYTSYTEEKRTYRRSISPQDDYRTTRDHTSEYKTPHMFVETDTERTMNPAGEEVTETTTTRTTTYSISPTPTKNVLSGSIYEDTRNVDIEKRRHSPEREAADSLRRVNTESKHAVHSTTDKFMRTQSDDAVDREPPRDLHRSVEVERIYDDVPHGREEKGRSYDREREDRDTRDAVYEERYIGDVQPLGRTEEMPHSPPVSTPTTPRMSSKFKREDGKTFDFGKSKFSSKHEVVRRGKDVEVKMDSLKLGKEDVLRVVVMGPPRNGATGEPHVELEPKVKKSGSKYEISFKPMDVGTHKVFAYVNDIQHPLSPFAIRVFDSSEIVVGDIPQHSYLNDTVEFTVDAGRAGFGNLEMAIKDADGVIIPSHVAQLESGSAKFLVTFTPSTKGTHTVNITFNKELLKFSPFSISVADPPSDASPSLGADLEAPVSPELSKKDLKRQKEDMKREEKEKSKREKEERASTIKREKELKKAKKGHLPSGTTTVTKTPSLCRVGAAASMEVAVGGLDSLEITVTHAKKDEVGTKLTEIEPGLLEIQFTPLHVGEHEIEVKYAGVPVGGSPFSCRAYDPAKIGVSPIPNGVVSRPVHFVVDASEAGVGNLEVAVNDGKIPSMANGLGQHRYDISFIPTEEVDHFISVRFNNEPVPGSPFLCRLVSATRVTAAGPGLERVAVETPCEFSVHGGGEEAPTVSIRGPASSSVPVSVTKAGDAFTCSYLPKAVGSYQVTVEHGGEPVPGSPFTAKAFDVRLAKLTPCESAWVGRPCHFSIDAANAGAGNMEIIVSVDGRNVPNFVQSEGQAKFRVSFTPQEEKEHTISVKFNGVAVPGSPMRCEVQKGMSGKAPAMGLLGTAKDTNKENEYSQRIGQGKHAAVVGHPSSFSLPVSSRGEVNVVVTDASGGPLPVRCYKQADDSYWVEFTPEDTGVHSIDVSFGDSPISGSPFKCTVVDPKKVSVSGVDAPLTLRHAATINVKKGGAGGDLSVDVSDPSGGVVRTEMLRSPRGDDSFTFLPNQTGPHTVNVRVAGFAVPGSPFTVNVEEFSHPTVVMEKTVQKGDKAIFIFDTKRQTGGVKVDVRDPKGKKLPHQVNRRKDGTMEVEFSPEEIGHHTVHVHFNSTPVQGSPFRVDVVEPSAVSVKGIESALLLRNAATISIDTATAGHAPIEVVVTDPTGSTVPTEMLRSPRGEGRVTFLPSKTGPHRVDVSIGGVRLPGYPKTVMVEEESPLHAPRLSLPREQTTGTVGDAVALHFNPSKQTGGIKVDVRGPDGRKVRHTTTKRADGAQDITFYPEDVGEYTANVEFNNRPVAGCPLVVRVVDPARVLVDDHLLERDGSLLLSSSSPPATIPVDLTAAGRGKLRVSVEDEQGRPVRGVATVEEAGYGKQGIVVSPRTPGLYSVFLSYEGHPVKGANPLVVVVGGGTDTRGRRIEETPRRYEEETRQQTERRERHVESEAAGGVRMGGPQGAANVAVKGSGIERPILNEANEFVVDGSANQRDGTVTASMHGQKVDVPVRISNLSPNVYRAVYTPLTPGRYELNVEWDGEHVKGSPFNLEVLPSSASAADLIVVDSSTLKIGVINDDVKTLIDTRAAGPGQLSAQCMGPVKLAYCELYDHRDGTYTLSVKPTEVGKHTLTIKYNERHVNGSPFLIHVSHPPDASKVRVYGPGVEHGILSVFKSNFVVETKGAGAGQLTVRVRGPKGAFNVEMQREKKNERTIHCKYEPREPGDYQVEVKWHGEHVPGSPFLVMIVDTEEELSRFLRGEAPSPVPSTPFIPPGWMGAVPPPLFLGPPGTGRPPFFPGGPPPGMAPPPHFMHGPPPPGSRMRQGKYANGY